MKQKPVDPAVANALTRAASLGVDVLSLKGKSLTALTQFFRGVDALTEERRRREREAKDFDLTADNIAFYGNMSSETIKKNPVLHALWEVVKQKKEPEMVKVPKKDYDDLLQELRRKDELIESAASLQMQLIEMQHELDAAKRASKSKDDRIATMLQQQRRLQNELIELRNNSSPFAS